MKKIREKIFITGGMGYIGTVFAKKALENGYDVCLYDSLIYEQNPTRIIKEILQDKKPKSELKLIIGDTRNIDLLEKSLVDFNPTYVLHFGELSSVYACNHNPTFTENINYNASKKVIDICEKLNLKIIYNSSSSVYGTQKESKLMKEGDELPNPTDYYCKFKLQMENYILNKKRNNPSLKIIVLRPATVFGLSPRFRIELLPNHFTYMAVSRKTIPLSGLNAYRAAIDIDELVDGYMRVIKKGKWDDVIYNIGHLNLSKKQFADGVGKVIKCKIINAPDVGDLRNLQIDCSKFNNEFNFYPKKPYTKSIENIARWITKHLSEIETKNFAEMLNMPLDKWRQICS